MLFSFQYCYQLGYALTKSDILDTGTWFLISSLHADKASSLREFFANKNVTRVDYRYHEAALRLFYYCFLQVLLCRCLHKKKTSNTKQVLGDPT